MFDQASLVDHVLRICELGDVVLIMINGGFDDICEKLLKRLRVSAG